MLAWILIGIALLMIELLSTSFFIVFFGAGALTVAALMHFFVLTTPYQILGFALLSLTYFALFRKVLKKRKKTSSFESELIGAIAITEEDLVPHIPGKILVGDTCWKAISGVAIQKGSQVKVLAHNNLTLEVTPL